LDYVLFVDLFTFKQPDVTDTSWLVVSTLVSVRLER